LFISVPTIWGSPRFRERPGRRRQRWESRAEVWMTRVRMCVDQSERCAGRRVGSEGTEQDKAWGGGKADPS